jgi:hypothetical protein
MIRRVAFPFTIFVIVSICLFLLAGCMSEGRKISQESIAQFAGRQQETYEKIVEASRTNPVPEPVARLVATMDEDAYRITKWTKLTQADLGRATGDIDLEDDAQARARAMYEREISARNAIKTAAARAGLPVETPESEGVAGQAEDLAKVVLGPVGASIFGMLWRHERKKKKLAEEKAERKQRAAREAISVIGQSHDTGIRKTAAMKQHLLQEFAELKMEEYEDRVREIENGTTTPASSRAPTTVVPADPLPGV